MTTRNSTDTDRPERRAAVTLLAAGIASPSEVAALAGVSRQLVNHWAASIDWRTARAERLAKAWQAILKRASARSR